MPPQSAEPTPVHGNEPAVTPHDVLWIDAGGLAGNGLDTGEVRLGGWIRVSYALGVSPIFVLGSARFSRLPVPIHGLSVQWISGALGAGVTLAETRTLRLLARLELVGELVTASINESSTETDAKRRGVLAARIGGDVVWMLRPWLGVLAGVDGASSSGTVISVHGERVGRTESLTYGGTLGFRGVLR